MKNKCITSQAQTKSFSGKHTRKYPAKALTLEVDTNDATDIFPAFIFHDQLYIDRHLWVFEKTYWLYYIQNKKIFTVCYSYLESVGINLKFKKKRRFFNKNIAIESIEKVYYYYYFALFSVEHFYVSGEKGCLHCKNKLHVNTCLLKMIQYLDGCSLF